MGDISPIQEFLPEETGVIDLGDQEPSTIAVQARTVDAYQPATSDLVAAVAIECGFDAQAEESEQQD